MSQVTRHRARRAPRHRRADRLQTSAPRRRPLVGAGLVLVLLVTGGIALASASPFRAGVVAANGNGTLTGVEVDRKVTAPARPAVTARNHGKARVAPYVVVEATRIQKESPAERRARLAKLVEQQLEGTIPTFGVAMLNILGSQHTAGPGGYGPGTGRAYTATRMLLAQGVSLIGFSEIQRDQVAVFRNNAPGWQVWPGDALGAKGVPQSVAWNTGVWEFVEATTVSIPFSGQIRPQPIVKLAHVETGTEIWFMNVHNSPQGMELERDRATVAELTRINQLAATGVPIVLTGDFNEKEEAFCRFTGDAPLVSAVGGTNDGACLPPPRPRVDWIFVSPEFTRESYVVTRSAPVPSITDHAALYSWLSLQ